MNVTARTNRQLSVFKECFFLYLYITHHIHMSTRVSMSDENVAIFSLYQQDYTDLPAHESDI